MDWQERMEEMRNAYMILVRKHQRKTPVGKPWHR
jgi:hypothetical protein